MSLVIFDLDNTLVFGQSQFYLLFYLYRIKKVSTWFLVKMFIWFIGYKLGFITDPRKAVLKSFLILKGKSVKEYEVIFNSFYEDVLKNKLNDKCLTRLEYHKKRHDHIVLLSNVVKPLALVVAKKLGIDLVFASEPEVLNGVYTGNINGDISYGENKFLTIKKFFSDNDLADSYAYADHYSDLPVLNLVKHPCVVNPDKKLLSVAKKNNWLVL